MKHSIRLARPWLLVASILDCPPSLVVRRTFHLPTGLVFNQQIRLTATCQPGTSVLAANLNGIDLLATDSQCDVLENLGQRWQWLVTRRLSSTINRIELTLAVPNPSLPMAEHNPPNRFDPSAWVEVTLEIESGDRPQ